MKSENQVSNRLKHLSELFDEPKTRDVTDMVIVAVMRELIWVLDDKQEASDQFG